MENLDFSEMFSSDLITTNKGGKKENIYKKSIFEGVKSKKNMRIKLRKFTENLFISAIKLAENKDTEKLNRLAKEFSDYYKKFYISNDYSFSSVASNNLGDEKKVIFIKGLEIFKSINCKSETKKANKK